ncbi:LysM peptidoglycan-binding domain-containing protein [Paenibacillus pasadenensis]|uniref:LysM peptidoglycan-binding domain-containing protein n=1 Tax=Paenibacillus pasadenensis TaxID=217090 RepID=UPI00203F4A79|nr:LysM peptidoglycan-binding domain-containing protein [Paenibacillus pasadenensis]
MKIHIVKKGDTLYLIGQKYGVSVEEIQKLNPNLTNPHNLLIGTKVKVPSPAGKPSAPELIHKYKVKLGDTLWKLSKAWGVSLQELIKANPQITDPAKLKEGDTVHIPKPSTPAPLTAEHKAESHTGHAGKKNTAVIPKAETAPVAKPETMVEAKPETTVEVEIEKEIVAQPVQPPPPVLPEQPAAKPVEKKPSYGSGYMAPAQHGHHHGKMAGEAVHPFKQEKIPATEALAPLFQLPQMPEMMASTAWPAHHGYSSGYSPEIPGIAGMNAGNAMPGWGAAPMSGGYGAQPTVAGAAQMPSYGMAPMQTMPVNMGGYGGMTEAAGMGGYGAGYDAPVGGVSGGGYGGYGSYGMQPSVFYPAQTAGAADSYGMPAVWPANAMPAGGGYGWDSATAPAATMPGMGYGGAGYMAGAAAGMAGYGAYGAPQVQGVAAQPGYGAMQAAEMAPDYSGAYSYGGGGTWQPQATLPAAASPMPGYAQWGPGMVAGAQPYGQPAWPAQHAGLSAADGYGGAQPAAAGSYSGQLSPVKAQPCGCGERTEPGADVGPDSEEAAPAAGFTVSGPKKPAKTGTASQQRKPSKKAVIRTEARPTVRQYKTSRPWINQN